MRSAVGDRPVYVSLDIDSVDPAFAPGTGTPEVGGLTSYQILQLVRGLQGLNLVGFDLVEVSPPYDHGDITSILAANLAFEFISLLAVSSSLAQMGGEK
jgi:arginase family enzyme